MINIIIKGGKVMAYKAVKINRSSSGWGGPLVLKPTDKKNVVASITGGGIDPIAKKIAEMSGAEAIDAFTNSVPEEKIMCVVIDCGGTARAGVYPKKRIPTVNLTPAGQVGPLAKFIKEDIYVSGVKESTIEYAEDESEVVESEVEAAGASEAGEEKEDINAKKAAAEEEKGGITGFIANIGRAMGGVVGIFYQAGRETIDQLIKNIIPFMAFIATIIGIINATGLGEFIANTLSPLASTLPGLLLLTIIASLPFLSPILGPGAVIAQIIGVMIGVEIGKGNIPPQFALPALFAINPQVGCDFVPVGLSLGEAEPETQEIGVPAVLISRVITGPAATIIAYFASFGLYS